MPTPDFYRRLNPDKIVNTIDLLSRRIRERFPDSGLYRVAVEVHRVSEEAVVRAQAIRRPNLPLRIVVILLLAALIAVVSQVYGKIRVEEDWNLQHLVQSFEAAISSVVFIGAAIFFLFSLEQRMKRKRAFDAVRELRSLAHIIDMHQLTKDPERVTGRGLQTASSPKRTMTPFELGRYLDYCSELLSLVSKTGALYVQEFPDPPTVEAFDQMTNLTTDLSRNIWQKIMILEASLGPAAQAAEASAPEAKPQESQPAKTPADGANPAATATAAT